MAKATKLPSGNWNMYVYVGRDENGKKIMKSFTAPSKREVELLAAQYKAAIPKNGSMLLREAYTKYCDSRRHVLSGSTMREYARIAKSSKYPLMDMDVNEITTHDIQSAVDHMCRDHSPKTVRNHYGLLSRFSHILGTPVFTGVPLIFPLFTGNYAVKTFTSASLFCVKNTYICNESPYKSPYDVSVKK